MPDVRSVALGFWVDVGSRDESLEFGGVSHFLAPYRAPNLVLAAAANLHRDDVAAGLERRRSPIPGQRPARDNGELAPPRRQIVFTRPTEQANVVVGMRALPRGDDDRFALSALNQVRRRGMPSRLFQVLREHR